MSLKKNLRTRRTLVFQLTIWYASVFTLSLLIIAIPSYLLMESRILDRIDRTLLHEVEETLSFYTMHGVDAVKTAMIRDAYAEDTEQVFYRLLDVEGNEVASSDLSAWGPISVNDTALQLATGEPVLETVNMAGEREKARIIYARVDPGLVLQIGHALEQATRPLGEFRKVFGATTLLAFACSTLVGWFMTKRTLAPIEAVTQTAINISSGSLTQRVDVTSGAVEVNRLATAFNQMLERIQVLVDEMTEVNENIAHDLRSPLARIRGAAERILANGQPGEEGQSMSFSIIEDCDKMLVLVDTMLEISEMNAGVRKMQQEELDLVAVVREVFELFRFAAEDKQVNMRLDVPDELQVRGDRQRLRRALANIVDNAVKYTPADGEIAFTVNGTSTLASVSVCDTGCGIPEGDQDRVFERFYRADPSRSDSGNGLGLSLTLAVVKAHQGSITLSSRPEEGTRVSIFLPRTPVRAKITNS